MPGKFYRGGSTEMEVFIGELQAPDLIGGLFIFKNSVKIILVNIWI